MIVLSSVLAAVLLPALPAHSQMKVVSLQGGLTAKKRALKAGDVIPETTVKLSKGGTAVLETPAGRFLLKGPAEFKPAKAGVFLRSGGLLSVLGRLKGRYTVRTLSAVAAVRGTDFFVEARGPKETYICICQGTLEASGKGMAPKEISAEHHAASLFRRSPKGLEQVPAGMENHTDEELEELRGAFKP